MPQADPDLRARMNDRFGSHVSDEGPIRFLEDAGYKMTKGFEWEPKPGVQTLRDMTRDEFECLLFLAHEWDFGSLTTEPRP